MNEINGTLRLPAFKKWCDVYLDTDDIDVATPLRDRSRTVFEPPEELESPDCALVSLMRRVLELHRTFQVAESDYPTRGITWSDLQTYWQDRPIFLELFRRIVPLFLECLIPRAIRRTDESAYLAQLTKSFKLIIGSPSDPPSFPSKTCVFIAPRQNGKSVGLNIFLFSMLASVHRSPIKTRAGISTNIHWIFMTKDGNGTREAYDRMLEVMRQPNAMKLFAYTDFSCTNAKDISIRFTNKNGVAIHIQFKVVNSGLIGRGMDGILFDECFQHLTTQTIQTGSSSNSAFLAYVKAIKPMFDAINDRIFIATSSVADTSNPLYCAFKSNKNMNSYILTTACSECIAKNMYIVCPHYLWRYGGTKELYNFYLEGIDTIMNGTYDSRRKYIQETIGIPQPGPNVEITEEALSYFLAGDTVYDKDNSRILQLVIGVDPGHSQSKTAFTVIAVGRFVLKYKDVPPQLRGFVVQYTKTKIYRDRVLEPDVVYQSDQLVAVRYSHIGKKTPNYNLIIILVAIFVAISEK